jgi:hypothetical protein
MSCSGLREQANVPIVPLAPNTPVVGYGVRVLPNMLGSEANVGVVDPMMGYSTTRMDKLCARFSLPEQRLDQMLVGTCHVGPYTERIMPAQTRRIQAEADECRAMAELAVAKNALDWSPYEPEPAPF